MLAAAINLLACMTVFSLVEWLWASPNAHKWWRRPLMVDLWSWLVLPLSLSAGISLAVLCTDVVVAALPRGGFWLVLARARETISAIPICVQAPIAFVVLDFFSYWLHRAYHRFPLLWSFHVFHHSAEHLDWLTTLRVHPISQLIDNAVMAAVLLLAGISVKAVAVANALIAVSALVTHANVPWTFGPLGRLFVSPLFHQWHHARLEGGPEPPRAANFGAAMSLWDKIFGTWALPSPDRPTSFGMEDPPRLSLAALLLHPLRVVLRAILRKR